MYVAEAVGASSESNLLRSSAQIRLISDGNEVRFEICHPRNSEWGLHITYPKVLLSSLPPVFTPAYASGADEKGAGNPLFIPPWQDCEMLGHAVLEGFRMAGPPFVKGVNSVFDAPTPKRRTALHKAVLAGDLDKIPPERQYGKNFDPWDTSGATPLMLAAQRGHAGMVGRLLFQKVDPRMHDQRRRAPLHYAAESGDPAVLGLLIEAGARVNDTDAHGRTPLHTAAERGHLEAVRLLLAMGSTPDTADGIFALTPLHLAARGNHAGVAQALVGGGADVNAPNEQGRTPLHVAAGYGHLEVIEALVRAGAEVNGADNHGRRPLHLPCFFQWDECITLLIRHGADVGAGDAEGKTPLHVAARMNRDRAARLLLDAGADAEARNTESMTPLDLATINRHLLNFPLDVDFAEISDEDNAEVADVLVEHGASVAPERLPLGDRHVLWPHLTPDWLLKDGMVDYPKMPDLSEQQRQALNDIDVSNPDSYRVRVFERGSLPHDAVAKQLPRVAAALLKEGANPDTGLNGAAPLHIAAAYGLRDLVELLLSWGADLERPICTDKRDGHHGYGRAVWHMETPLDVAVAMGEVRMVRFLLDRGAQPYPPETYELSKIWKQAQPQRASWGWVGPGLLALCPASKWEEMKTLFEEYGLPVLSPLEEEDYFNRWYPNYRGRTTAGHGSRRV